MKYEQTHPWLVFGYNPAYIKPHVWALLGECASKIDHISNTPLRAGMRENMHEVYLVKGAQATTAIEGNTLSEEQIKSIINRKPKVPGSFRYQEKEMENILSLFEDIGKAFMYGTNEAITPELICNWNKRILDGAEGALAPGMVREKDVVVSNYQGAPPQDCPWLLSKLCEWNEQLKSDHDQKLHLNTISNAILRSIIIHLYLVWIHPFMDGNGRTARLLEFAILLGSGVPTPAAHLLSNYYNLTRDMYYLRLNESCQIQDGMQRFIEYAVTGLRDQLIEQLNKYVYPQLWHLTIKDQIAVTFNGLHGKIAERRRTLIDSMTLDNALEWAEQPISELRKVSVGIAMAYLNVGDVTLKRDIQWLTSQGLLEIRGDKVSIAISSVVERLPDRRTTGSGW